MPFHKIQKSISFSKYRLASLWAFETTDSHEEYFIEARAAAILTASFTLIPEDWLQYSVISTKIILLMDPAEQNPTDQWFFD